MVTGSSENSGTTSKALSNMVDSDTHLGQFRLSASLSHAAKPPMIKTLIMAMSCIQTIPSMMARMKASPATMVKAYQRSCPVWVKDVR